MLDLTTHGNHLEAALWCAVSVTLLIRAFRADPRLRRTLALLSVAFLIFGISDLIEAQTGAWWRPFWLLMIKGACVAVFLFGFRKYYRINKSLRSQR